MLALSLVFCTPTLLVFAEENTSQESSEETIETIVLTTPEDVLALAESCRLDTWSQGRRVSLEADIDLTGTGFTGIPTFGGTLEGNGYTISGLSITAQGNIQGLFRYLQSTAVIQNLNVEGEIAPSGTSSTLGGIAGTNAGKLIHCSFSGSVSGADAIGGLAGCNEVTGILENCTSKGTLQGSHYIGGLVGENHGVIRECANYAEVNTTAAQNNVSLEDITLENLTNTESINTATDMGGIAGTSSGVIRSCENYGNVGYKSMSYNAGGIAGSLTGYLVDCVNHGTIYARKDVGGIVGQLEPSNVIDYDTDTLQILNGQLNSLSSTAHRTSAHVSSGSQQIDSQLSSLQNQTDNAKAATKTILGEFKIDGKLPDPDTILAARSDLTTNLKDMQGSMEGLNSSITSTAGTLVNDINTMIKQMQGISSTISNADENLGITINDISDLDTEEDTLSKIASCINLGDVHADQNGGGIVGTMSLENDLDPEDDVEISGELSLNLSYETRAVTRDCENQAPVYVKKYNAGGIVGNMGTGAVMDCINLGAVDSEAADRVGGIAGSSSGIIRRCDVKCEVTGQSQIGGIAGIGATVTDCRTLVRIEAQGPEIGTILGSSQTAMSLQNTLSEEERTVSGNYYLAAGKDLGAVDGISYSGCAEPISLEDFLAIEELPEFFQTMTIRFVCDEQEDITFQVPISEAFPVEQIPEVPVKDGHNGVWENLDTADLSQIWFDETFTAVYTSYHQTIQAENTRENGLPIVLAEGSFPDGAALIIEPTVKSATIPDGAALLESWQISPNADTSLIVHYLPAADADIHNVDIYVQDSLGTWTKRTSSIDGSYLVFSIAEDETTFCAIQLPVDHTPMMAAACGAAALVVLIVIVVVVKKCKKKKTLS